MDHGPKHLSWNLALPPSHCIKYGTLSFPPCLYVVVPSDQSQLIIDLIIHCPSFYYKLLQSRFLVVHHPFFICHPSLYMCVCLCIVLLASPPTHVSPFSWSFLAPWDPLTVPLSLFTLFPLSVFLFLSLSYCMFVFTCSLLLAFSPFFWLSYLL